MQSKDACYARAARCLAADLGCLHRSVPGNHLPFLFQPDTFAADVRAARVERQAP